MRHRSRFVLPLAVVAVLGAWQAWAAFDDDEISSFTIDGGGGNSSAGDFSLSGTIGQPDAGHSSNGSLELNGGFWGQATNAIPVGVNDAPLRREAHLYPAVPNPFNPRTTLRFDLPADSHVRVEVHDARGRRVRVLADGKLPRGEHEMVWNAIGDDGNAVASGVYYLRLVADGQVQLQKMTLLK